MFEVLGKILDRPRALTITAKHGAVYRCWNLFGEVPNRTDDDPRDPDSVRIGLEADDAVPLSSLQFKRHDS